MGGCARAHYPGIYTRVKMHLPWIYSHVRKRVKYKVTTRGQGKGVKQISPSGKGIIGKTVTVNPLCKKKSKKTKKRKKSKKKKKKSKKSKDKKEKKKKKKKKEGKHHK